MRNLLYVVAGLLTVIWVIIFLSFNASGLVHVLLILAIIVLLFRVFSKKRLSNK